ncbi:MAG: hypothetical protein ACTH3E_11140 [Psychroflexus halocasei]
MKTQVSIVLLINLVIGLIFYLHGKDQSYEALSSDQLNIVPMCLKLDDPALFQNDLFLDDVSNFEYYTPFFVKPLRWFKNITGLSYLNSINILHSITHILYGFMWFLLFYFISNRSFIASLFLSIIARGIFWLPGMEIWGVSELWTYMPRTVYSTFLPIPFIILFFKTKYKLIISSFVIGLIFNFHPITGLGGVLIFLLTVIYFKSNFVEDKKDYVKFLLISIVFMFLGMLPFIMNYFGNTSITNDYNLELYQTAFDARIPSYFKSMSSYVQKWIHFKSLFIIVPIILLYVLPYFLNVNFKYRNYILLVFASLFLLPLLSIPVESFINDSFGANLRMSFQIVRIQKMIVLPGYIALLYLLIILSSYNKTIKYIVVTSVFLYFLIVPFAHYPVFKKFPFIADDITTMILPNKLNFSSDKKNDIDRMGEYIKSNLPKNAVFFDNTILRTVAERSVRLDHKGASILIEGNPKKLIEWKMISEKIKQNKQKPVEMFDLMKNIGITHIVSSDDNIDHLTKIKSIGKLNLYSLN